MKTRDALRSYLMERDLLPAEAPVGDTPSDWYSDPWFRISVGGRRIPFWPMIGFRHGIVVHDLHHLLTGYATDLKGEAALAGWELGSGGCGWDVLFWVDRLFVFAVALVLAPSTAVRGFRRGLRSRNLYRRSTEAILDEDIEAVRGFVDPRAV